MAVLYTTKQGQTVDLVCWLHYKRTREVAEVVLDANPGVADLGPILPMGTALTLPDIQQSAVGAKLVSLWD